MAAYDLLAAYYDAVTGDSATEATYIDGIIKHACRRAVTVLEVACGTADIIARLAAGYQVSGLDISPGMLAVAREKLPEGTPLYLADMSTFKLETTFDAIAVSTMASTTCSISRTGRTFSIALIGTGQNPADSAAIR